MNRPLRFSNDCGSVSGRLILILILAFPDYPILGGITDWSKTDVCPSLHPEGMKTDDGNIRVEPTIPPKKLR